MDEREETFGEKVYRLVKEKKVNQAEFARRVNQHRQALQNIRSRRSIPLKWLIILRDEFGLDLVKEGVLSDIVTVEEDDFQDSKIMELYDPKSAYNNNQSKKRTMVSLLLEIEEGQDLHMTADMESKIMDFIRKEHMKDNKRNNNSDAE